MCPLDQSIIGSRLGNADRIVQCPTIHARTSLAGGIPITAFCQQGLPKWPGTTLLRTIFVDRATFALSKENTVIIGLFRQADAALADRPRVLATKRRFIKPKTFGQGKNLAIVDPHIAWCAGTAVAALGAGEAQSIFEPGLGNGRKSDKSPEVR